MGRSAVFVPYLNGKSVNSQCLLPRKKIMEFISTCGFFTICETFCVLLRESLRSCLTPLKPLFSWPPKWTNRARREIRTRRNDFPRHSVHGSCFDFSQWKVPGFYQICATGRFLLTPFSSLAYGSCYFLALCSFWKNSNFRESITPKRINSTV